MSINIETWWLFSDIYVNITLGKVKWLKCDEFISFFKSQNDLG